MVTYAVGDLQGCLDPLRHLLDEVRFEPATDRLWLVGDLVNRGPDSLGTLRFLRSLGSSVVAVLGNHDLHLLAVALGGQALRPKDTLAEILAAPDREALLDWLRTRPMIHHAPALNAVLVHAGLPFLFSLAQALELAREVEEVIRGDDASTFLAALYGNEPVRWSPELTGHDRLRIIVNYFTRMRFLDATGALEFATKSGVEKAPPGYFPWFERLPPDLAPHRIVFGHWAALRGRGVPANCLALDTGCVWGGCMTLLRLEDGVRWSRSCAEIPGS